MADDGVKTEEMRNEKSPNQYSLGIFEVGPAAHSSSPQYNSKSSVYYTIL